MIKIGNAIVSDDLAEKEFVCHLAKCKGACCEEGDSGAPLEGDEPSVLEQHYEVIKPFLSDRGREAIEKKGSYMVDGDGDQVTPLVNNRECAYAFRDNQGVLKCAIERAWEEGKLDFRKPLSCHLYPVRITRYDQYEAVNYDRRKICNPACGHGKHLGVPLYKFLKEPLKRKYGEEWYRKLENTVQDMNREKK